MSKKYLSLEEAAQLLAIPTDELIRMRERSEIRGFADRGTWKFKLEDVESLARSRQADSSPEVPLFAGDDSDSDVGEQPTVIRRDPAGSDDHLLVEEESRSLADSDVRLVGSSGEIDLGYDSDSDVKLVGMDSDSDVKLAGADSDSDVQLVEGQTAAPAASDSLLASKDSDSDVQLLADSGDVGLVSGEEDAIAISFDDDSPGASVLAEGSGISLGGDSSLLLGGESGISLEGPSDSGLALGANDDEGITLALDDDSGISLDAGDSGISLEAIGDSGISLESDPRSGTIPMMDALSDDDVAETQFEIPSLEDDDSGYEIRGQGSSAETTTLDAFAQQEAGLDDAVFDLDEGEASFETGEEFEGDELDLEEDAFGEEEDLDVFDADEEAFEEVGGEEEFVSSIAGRMPMVEAEWGTGTFVGLTLATLFLLVCGAVMVDLVKNTSTAATPNPVSGMVLDALGGLYKK